MIHYILYIVLTITSVLCLSVRRKNETGFSIETLCHDPSKPLYGVMLEDYNSSTCVMKEKNTTSGMAHFCSCTDEEECNDNMLFSPSEYTTQMPCIFFFTPDLLFESFIIVAFVVLDFAMFLFTAVW